jgi:hypothetical protein
MLTPLAALPLVLATALGVPTPASSRAGRDPGGGASWDATRPESMPSLETSPRVPDPVLRRCWSALGRDADQLGAPTLLRGGIRPATAMTTEDGRARQLPSRGPPRRVC